MADLGGSGNANGANINGPFGVLNSYMEVDEISLPSNPSANKGRIYARDVAGTTTPFFLDSAGTETSLIGAGGGGDVSGPGAAVVDNRLVTWNTTSGTDVQDGTSITAELVGGTGGINTLSSADRITITSSTSEAAGIDINTTNSAAQVRLGAAGTLRLNANKADVTSLVCLVSEGGSDWQTTTSASQNGPMKFNAATTGAGVSGGGDATFQTLCNNSTSSAGDVIIQSIANTAGAGTGKITIQTVLQGGATSADDIEIISAATGATAINIDSSGGVDIDAAGDFNVTLTGSGSDVQFTTASTSSAAFDLNATAGGFDLDTVTDINLTSVSTATLTKITLQQDNNAAVLGGGVDIIARQTLAGGTGGKITLQTSATAGNAGDIEINSASAAATAINIDSSGGIDVDASGNINIATSQSNANALQLLATDGGMQIKSTVDTASQRLDIQQENTGAVTGGGVLISSANTNASGTGGNIELKTEASAGTPAKIVLNSANTSTDSIQFTAGGGITVSTGTAGMDMQDSPFDQMAFKRRAVGISFTTTGEVINAITSTAIVRTITIASADVADGKIMFFKDESGGAGTNNITIATQGSETIDGNSTLTISANYGVVGLYSDGTNWFTLT